MTPQNRAAQASSRPRQEEISSGPFAALRPSYEQLEEIIRLKDRAVSNSYWNAHALWSIAWLAYQARESGNVDFNDEKYAEASSYAIKHIAEQAKNLHEVLDEEHRLAATVASHDAGGTA